MSKHAPVFLDESRTAAPQLQALSPAREIAVDTEGSSFHRYVDRVYLLQLSTRERSAIVDPLSVPAETLAPLGALLESPLVETVFHDADYDLRLLFQDYGWHVRHVFDTRIAAQLLGIKAFGLAALLEQYFGVKLDKKHQRADWSMRPLTPEMLEYAAQDTMYLLALRDRLREELDRRERLSWAREEFALLEGTRWPEEDSATAFMRVKGARDLTRRELAVLRELVVWREDVARHLDRATFRVIGHEQLLAIARLQPRTREDLGRIKGVSRGILEHRSHEVVAAVSRGQQVPEDELPKFPKAPRWDRDPRFDTRVNALKTVRDQVSQRLDLDPGVLCARDRMEAVARRNPQNLDELRAIEELRNWQKDVLGGGFVTALRRVQE